MNHVKPTKTAPIKAPESLQAISANAPPAEAQQSLLQNLQVQQIDLKRQNRELLEAPQNLEASRDRYADLYAFAPLGYVDLDKQGSIVEINLTGAAMLGVGRPRLLGMRFVQFVAKSDRLKFRDHLAQSMAGNAKAVITLCLQAQNGQLIKAELLSVAVPTPFGKLCHTAIIDISAREQAEEKIARLNAELEARVLERTAALQESENRYHVLFDGVPTPLWEIDITALKNLLAQWREQGVIDLRAFFDEHPEAVEQCLDLIETLDVNQAMLHLYKANSKEQLRFNDRRIWNTESMSAFKDELLTIAEGRTDYECETSKQTLTGEKINVWSRFHVVPSNEKSRTRIFIVTFDITERKKIFDKLQASRARLRALSAHLQTSREQERLAIARDLHDELGQSLTALKIDLSMMARKVESANGNFDGATVLGEIAAMQERIARTIKYVRGLITELRPEVLDTLGLIPALEWQLQEFHKRTGVAYEFHTEVEELPLEAQQAVAVFRIFQECLTNVARHAHAGRVSAKIEKRDQALWVEIADNGKGISPEQLHAPGKFGLLGMHERALVFGGEVSIIGMSGQGTTVKIKVPLTEG